MNRIHNKASEEPTKPTLKVDINRKVTPRLVRKPKETEKPVVRTDTPLARTLNRLVNKHEVAKVLDIKVSTVERWIRNGTIPCYKIGTEVRFDIEEIIERNDGKGKGVA